MMRIIGALAATALLSGCAGSVIGDRIAGPEKLAQQDDAYCQSIGLKFGTPDYASCRLQTTQRREDRHFQATQSAGDDLIAAGAAISANSR
jgi:hypothetical protein